MFEAVLALMFLITEVTAECVSILTSMISAEELLVLSVRARNLSSCHPRVSSR